MKKTYFIFLGKPGLIYFSWLFLILFIGLIIAYEGTSKINWLSISVVSVFFLILIYTLINSYYTKQYIKLPYCSKKRGQIEPEIIWSWKFISIEKVKTDSLNTFWLFKINKKKDED